MPPSGGGDAGVHRRGAPCPRRGAKGGKGTVWFPCPLLIPPNPPLHRDSLRSRGETGVTGVGSVRRAGFWKPYYPEFSLRQPPRITVRGQTVQGGGVPLRKAPLPSSVCPWSTKRPCGPLAFRRATVGSRVPKEGQGSQEGTGNHVWCPVPFCPCRWAPTSPTAEGGHCARSPRA